MAKGLRAKTRRRLRTARREHFQEIQGKSDQQKIVQRLNNPYYDLRSDFSVKANAFVEPNNPQAVFPQIAKPNIMDFRSHKMAKGGWTGVNNFRKIHSENAIKSKYESVVKTNEDLERDAQNKEQQMESDSEEEVQVAQSKAKKNYTIDDIMQLDSKLSIGKKKKQAAPALQASNPVKKEKKKVFSKKSKKIIKF
ncbi:UNKNOWN [Stylonychia lemnae]|uniref:Uncharacterized protein n=1 Tax=Stylonychia lemnae TaxID=5949 RepID=A0A078AYA2_STYLE|nr:UNKNOWN [Stylonychia lemnae]|eukprot:CDW87144.1 UNKNOWN [Stylonychia lemnae]